MTARCRLAALAVAICASGCLVDFPPLAPDAGQNNGDSGRDRDSAIEDAEDGDAGADSGVLDATPVAEWRIVHSGEIEVDAPRTGDRLGMAYDEARAEMIVYGGSISQTDKTWSWSSGAWIDKSVTTPPTRRDHAMAYHAGDQRIVVFGGQFDDSLANMSDETWLWDGAAWSRDMRPGPSARVFSVMAYDRARAVLVLFGGRLPTAGLPNADDTWEWDLAGGWRMSAAARPYPQPRRHHGMVYDPIASRVVIVDGQDDGGHYLGDRWSYGGSPVAWTELPLTSFEPPPRSHVSMAFDERRGVLVMFGGAMDAAGTRIDETWELAGGAWTQQFPSPHPTARVSGAMLYDPRVERLLLVGGHPHDIPTLKTWEYGF